MGIIFWTQNDPHDARHDLGHDLICYFCERPGYFKAECYEKQKWEVWKKSSIANVAYSQDAMPSYNDNKHTF
jgi:hypothetical protein